VQVILPLSDIETVSKERGLRWPYHGLAITVRGHEDLYFDFHKKEVRDDCAVTILRRIENLKFMESLPTTDKEEELLHEAAEAEHKFLQEARKGKRTAPMSDLAHDELETGRAALIFDDPAASIIEFKPSKPLKITCLTIGSRGDVQPYIALCKGLLAEGHKAKIATHKEFEGAVREHGIDFAPVAGDPAELMRLCIENGMFTFSFIKEANSKFRSWITDLMDTAWEACQGSELLIESPSAMIGLHIAEALRIPYFRAFGMPWTKTRTYPHAFAAIDRKKLGGQYNQLSYMLFDSLFWSAIAGQINQFRKTVLGLRSTSMIKMQANLRPFLYMVSPSVLVPPLDWPDWIRVTGYWFLNSPPDYKPPDDLDAFLKRARKDGKKIVYIGFGSIVVEDSAALTKAVIESILKADVRCVLSKGWSDRVVEKTIKDSSKPEVPLPPEIFQIREAPHDWLFAQLDAAVHHGGSGTTGASLRAGIPTIIKPFFGDQHFFGTRVEDLGVGILITKINVSVLGAAIWKAVNDERLIVRARYLGEKIRKVGVHHNRSRIFIANFINRRMAFRSQFKPCIESSNGRRYLSTEAMAKGVKAPQTSQMTNGPWSKVKKR
jgi:sterol 3beta-glucosyltransferase